MNELLLRARELSASLTSRCDFDLANDEARVAELEDRSSEPGFWDDAEAARPFSS